MRCSDWQQPDKFQFGDDQGRKTTVVELRQELQQQDKVRLGNPLRAAIAKGAVAGVPCQSEIADSPKHCMSSGVGVEDPESRYDI